MTTQDLATEALQRWALLRQEGLSCRERLNDPELQRLERELEAVRAEMAPIRQAIERTR
jgi:hypothetical protein